MSETPKSDKFFSKTIFMNSADTLAGWFKLARELEKENADLKNCVEKMKNCMNCKHSRNLRCAVGYDLWEICVKSDNRKHWEVDDE